MARLAKGFSLKEFAQILGVSTCYLSKAENNHEAFSGERLDQIVMLLELDRARVAELRKYIDSELEEIIFSNFEAVSTLIRSLKGLNPEQVTAVMAKGHLLVAEYNQ